MQGLGTRVVIDVHNDFPEPLRKVSLMYSRIQGLENLPDWPLKEREMWYIVSFALCSLSPQWLPFWGAG